MSLFVSAAPATAAPVCSSDDPFPFCWFTGGPGWTRVNWALDHCPRCHEEGQEGVLNGEWPEYRCGWFPAGLDVVYYIYVPA